jgi:hypothetical protein
MRDFFRQKSGKYSHHVGKITGMKEAKFVRELNRREPEKF